MCWIQYIRYFIFWEAVGDKINSWLVMFLTRNVKDFSTPGITKKNEREREQKSMNSLNYITWNTWWNTLNLHTLAPHVFFYPDIPRHATFAVLDGRQRNTVHVNKPSCLHEKNVCVFPPRSAHCKFYKYPTQPFLRSSAFLPSRFTPLKFNILTFPKRFLRSR